LIGGVNKWQNFCGIGTATTAVYGVGEMAIKFSPIFLFVVYSCTF